MSRKHNYFKYLINALILPTSIIFLFVGVISALILYSPFNILISLVCIVSAIYFAVRKTFDPMYIKKVNSAISHSEIDNQSTERMFRVEELDAESRVKVKMIIKLQNEIATYVEDSALIIGINNLEETVQKTKEIVDRSLEIAKKRPALIKYLSHTDINSIKNRIEYLKNNLTQQTDNARINEIQISLNAKIQERNDYEAIVQSSKRILEQLDTIECSFSSLKARIVRLMSSDITDWASAKSELSTELSGLNSSVNSIEESINEVISIGQIQN